ncbi:MAG: rod-binding protein [Candidatus Eremiobacteraeota bacterium]|nr:rod-binding protein [Candidatus Eremiobacteraeota bacterium]
MTEPTSGISSKKISVNAGSAESLKHKDDLKHKDEELMKACKDFEGIFLEQILKAMDHTGIKSHLFGQGNSGKMWSSMMDQEKAKIWAQQGGLGMAHMLYEQMKGEL